MPPEAMTVRNSKLCSMTGSMMGWPHFLHSSVAKGAKLPEMNVLALQRPHVTIFSGLPPPPVVSLLTNSLYHPLPMIGNCNVARRCDSDSRGADMLCT